METLKKILAIVGLIVLIGLLLALPVMLLWNWLMPMIFGLIKLTFWQALGLTWLSACLFKSSSSSNKS